MNGLRAARRIHVVMLICAVGISAAVFWRTAYPTITWWDSSNYSLAAATLGITNAPGSLLLTMLGWMVTRVDLGLAPAHALNLLAGLLAAITVGLVYLASLRVLRMTGAAGRSEDRGDATALGAALGALTFAFSATLWEHAIKFTPYILTAVFTGLILLAMLLWWEHAERHVAWRWLLLLGFLFGLDFSVHRTNALLIPGAIVWILVRHPRTLVLRRSWFAAAAGLVAGLALHTLIIPIAANTRSPLNMFEPSNWSRFADYVSLAQMGGNFLVDLWPRKSDLWSVQAADFLQVLRENFLHATTPVRILGWLPAAAGVLGVATLWRRNSRLALALTLLLSIHAAATVLFFNIPAGFFRPFDRHYLPVFVVFGVLIACGTAIAARRISSIGAAAGRGAAVAALAALALVPAAQLVGNWKAHDAARRYFTRDYAANALGGLPPNAIYFTVGDNDTFPVMYLQSVEGVRPDVSIVNLSLANAVWYIERIVRRNPSFPLSLSTQAREALTRVDWRDTTIVIPVPANTVLLGVDSGTALPEAITAQPRPAFGTRMLPADVVLLDIVRTNEWRRPLAFSTTTGSSGTSWLKQWARLDGTFWRIVPVDRVAADPEILGQNLLERYEYRGYSDPSVRIDNEARIMGALYYAAINALLQAEEARGESVRCGQAKARLLGALPPDRLNLPATESGGIEARCRS
jgi:hypothetical protein